MKASLLFLLVCVGVLAAMADSTEEQELVMKKMQELAQKASAIARSAFSMVQESEVAQQTRQWLENNKELVKQRVKWVKDKLVELWKKAQAA